MKYVRRILMVALALLLMMSSSAWAEEQTEAEELYIIIDEPVQYTSVYEWIHPTESWGVYLLNAYYGTYHYSRELTDEEKALDYGHSGRIVSLDTGIEYSDVCCEFWAYENMFAVGLGDDLPAGKYEYTLIRVHGNSLAEKSIIEAEGKYIFEIGE